MTSPITCSTVSQNQATDINKTLEKNMSPLAKLKVLTESPIVEVGDRVCIGDSYAPITIERENTNHLGHYKEIYEVSNLGSIRHTRQFETKLHCTSSSQTSHHLFGVPLSRFERTQKTIDNLLNGKRPLLLSADCFTTISDWTNGLKISTDVYRLADEIEGHIN